MRANIADDLYQPFGGLAQVGMGKRIRVAVF
jgi:hypothetical protein